MAKPITLCHLIAATILIVFLVTCQPSSARPLNGAFPGEDGGVFLPPATEFPDRARPCHEMEQNFGAPTRDGRKYGPLFFSMLPKGQVPPSGPSKGINGDNN